MTLALNCLFGGFFNITSFSFFSLCSYDKSFLFFFFSTVFNTALVLLKMYKSAVELRVFPFRVVFFKEFKLYSLFIHLFTNISCAPSAAQPNTCWMKCNQRGELEGNVRGPMTLPALIWLCYDLHTEQKSTLRFFIPSVKPNQSARFMFIEVSMILLSSPKMQPSLSSRRHLMRESLLWSVIYILTSSVCTYRVYGS